MSHQEEKISKFLDYPYDSFLMLRLEFMLIFNDELTAKILRIIEKNVETERKHIYRKTVNKMGSVPAEVVEITTDIWVSISYKTFMTDLFGTVNSENTLKRAIKELEKMKVIFRRHEPKKKYDAPQYKIHQPVLQMLLSVLKMPGYQNLIPSIIDTLKNLPPQEMTPSECQFLIPSDENLSTKSKSRVSNFDPTYNNSNNKDNDNKDTYGENVASANSHAPTPLSLEDQLEAARQLLLAHGQTLSSSTAPEESQPKLSTPGTDLSPESVDKSVQTDEETSVPPQASEQSYSRETTQNTPAVVGDAPASEKPARPPRQRKPKVAKEGEPTQEQINAVYAVFDELFRAVLPTPDPDFSCTRTKVATESIKELIHCKATPVRLKAVFLNMWNDLDENTGEYWWRKRGRMSIKSVCNHYASRVISVENPQKSGKKSTVQQELEKEAEGFTIKSQSELMKMQPDKRKEYGRELNAFLAMKKETEKQQAQAEQASSQKAG